MTKVRHVVGISGGKDSAALAIYLKDKCPDLDVEYYFCDTGKELDDTYELIENLQTYLGKEITKLQAAPGSSEDPFDHFYKIFRGYLPSPQARWCTKELKLVPFENYIKDDYTVSYVGIRGDENREGYISTKPNIQSIFPFRKNIWSVDIWDKIFKDSHKTILDFYSESRSKDLIKNLLDTPVTGEYFKNDKINDILDTGISAFNHAVFKFLKDKQVSLSFEDAFPLLENEDVLVRKDIFQLLEDSGVGVPAYYKKLEYEVDGMKGEYARSRSGCFFCFFQQKIEWVWLYENHKDLFMKAMEYENEKEWFTWQKDQTLESYLDKGYRDSIKREHLKRAGKAKSANSKFLIDILDDTEPTNCIQCFI